MYLYSVVIMPRFAHVFVCVCNPAVTAVWLQCQVQVIVSMASRHFLEI